MPYNRNIPNVFACIDPHGISFRGSPKLYHSDMAGSTQEASGAAYKGCDEQSSTSRYSSRCLAGGCNLFRGCESVPPETPCSLNSPASPTSACCSCDGWSASSFSPVAGAI